MSDRFARQVERAFLGALSPRARRRLFDHLASCASCRTSYDRLACADRQLGAGSPIARTAVDAIEAAVIAGATRPSRRRLVWAGVAATAAIALAIVVVWPRGEPLVGRGGGGGGERRVGVRLFCIDPRGPEPVVVDDAMVTSSAPPPTLRCGLGGELQIAYSTPPRDDLSMVVFAARDDRVLLYAPATPDGAPVSLAADQIDTPLEWSTRLAVNHNPGRHAIVVRIYDRPIPLPVALTSSVNPIVELHGMLEVTP